MSRPNFSLMRHLIVVALSLTTAAATAGPFNTVWVFDWMNTKGVTIRAQLLKVSGNKVVLRGQNGQRYEVDASVLGSEEQKWVDYFRVRGEVQPWDSSSDSDKGRELEEAGLQRLLYVRNGKQLPFLLYRPAEEKKNVTALPLILFLHGLGGKGNDNWKNYADAGKAPHVFLEKEFQSHMPAYIVIPQSDEAHTWHTDSTTIPSEKMLLAVQLLDVLKAGACPKIDMTRLYVTGPSYGGIGTFEAIGKFPGKFAAAVPVACVYDTCVFNSLNTAPVRLFVNDDDPYVYLEQAYHLDKHFKSLKADFNLTVFKAKGHNAWTKAYGDLDFLRWLQRQQLKAVVYPSDPGTWLKK